MGDSGVTGCPSRCHLGKPPSSNATASVVVTGWNGKAIASSEPGGKGRRIPDLIPPPAATVVQERRDAQGAVRLEITVPLRIEGFPRGALRTEISLVGAEVDLLPAVTQFSLVWAALIALAAFGAAWFYLPQGKGTGMKRRLTRDLVASLQLGDEVGFRPAVGDLDVIDAGARINQCNRRPQFEGAVGLGIGQRLVQQALKSCRVFD